MEKKDESLGKKRRSEAEDATANEKKKAPRRRLLQRPAMEDAEAESEAQHEHSTEEEVVDSKTSPPASQPVFAIPLAQTTPLTIDTGTSTSTPTYRSCSFFRMQQLARDDTTFLDRTCYVFCTTLLQLQNNFVKPLEMAGRVLASASSELH